MTRVIEDADYIECLPSLYQTTYKSWRQRMLENIDSIVEDFMSASVEEVMEKRRLSPRDVALLVRLHYLTEEEVERFGLGRIERTVPV